MAEYTLVRNLIETLELEVVSGEKGLDKKITKKMLSRPGLELAGLLEFYEADRIQIIGTKELTFYKWLDIEEQQIRVASLFREKTPLFVFSNSFDIPELFIEFSNKTNITIARSSKNTTQLSGKLSQFLDEALAPTVTLHGVFLDVDGIGVLIQGGSGIGKSEAALELVKRGHKLVADDRVDIYERDKGMLVGSAPDILAKFMEIRGIGIINVVRMFGARAYRHKKRVTLVVQLETMDNGSQFDRLGLDDEKTKILNTELPIKKIPIRPGRNTASLIEVACLNHRLKFLGYNSAEEFADQLTDLISSNSEK